MNARVVLPEEVLVVRERLAAKLPAALLLVAKLPEAVVLVVKLPAALLLAEVPPAAR